MSRRKRSSPKLTGVYCLNCHKPVDLPGSRCWLCATGRLRDPRIVALAERPKPRDRHAWRQYEVDFAREHERY